MEDIDGIRDELRKAADLPDLLSLAWRAFDRAREAAGAAAGLSADLYPAFTFARGAAVSGRNAITAAPSMPPLAAGGQAAPVRGDSAPQAAGALAGLASDLAGRLHAAAGQASDASDRDACQSAAQYAAEIHGLLAGETQQWHQNPPSSATS